MGLYSPAIKKFNSAAWCGKEKEIKQKKPTTKQKNPQHTKITNQPKQR